MTYEKYLDLLIEEYQGITGCKAKNESKLFTQEFTEWLIRREIFILKIKEKNNV